MKIALDFDGVLHSDHQGLGSGNIIPDPAVPGAIEKFHELLVSNDVTEIHIYSLRCGGAHGIQAMQQWILQEYVKLFDIEKAKPFFEKVKFSFMKPHVDIFIDDKAIQFSGDWSAPQFSLENLIAFRPWNRNASQS